MSMARAECPKREVGTLFLVPRRGSVGDGKAGALIGTGGGMASKGGPTYSGKIGLVKCSRMLEGGEGLCEMIGGGWDRLGEGGGKGTEVEIGEGVSCGRGVGGLTLSSCIWLMGSKVSFKSGQGSVSLSGTFFDGW